MQVQVSAAGGGGGGEVGEYDIVYSLPSEGRYRMWIRVHGRDVQDSPFQVTRGTWLYTSLYTGHCAGDVSARGGFLPPHCPLLLRLPAPPQQQVTRNY